MASSSHNDYDDHSIDEYFDTRVDQILERRLQNISMGNSDDQAARKPKKKRSFIQRNRGEGDLHLRRDYFDEAAIYPIRLFRRCFRMNRPLFLRIVNGLEMAMPFFLQKKRCSWKSWFFCTTKVYSSNSAIGIWDGS